jgi:hypothetical protein
MEMPYRYRLAAQNARLLKGKSRALIRCRPDGSDPEVVCRGFVNLVEAGFPVRWRGGRDRQLVPGASGGAPATPWSI